jgi:glycerol uptake facilitator-like aquaporin
MDARLRAYLSELFGTFLVVLVGAGTLCAAFLPGGNARFATTGGVTLAVALAEGFALAVVLTATVYLSLGCCNPAITLALYVSKQLDGARTFFLILSQLLGAVLAGLLLRGLFSETVLAEARMGSPHLRALVSSSDERITLAAIATGVALELLFTALVTVAVYATLIDPRAPKLGGVAVGMAQTAVILFGFHLTGGAANPARWFGTAIWQLSLSNLPVERPLAGHPVYWVGPILGALAGSIFYTLIVLPPAANNGEKK